MQWLFLGEFIAWSSHFGIRKVAFSSIFLEVFASPAFKRKWKESGLGENRCCQVHFPSITFKNRHFSTNIFQDFESKINAENKNLTNLTVVRDKKGIRLTYQSYFYKISNGKKLNKCKISWILAKMIHVL